MIVWLLEGQRPEHIAEAFPEMFPKTDYGATLHAAYAHFEMIATSAPDPDPTDPSGLRRLLKWALRGLGLRCVHCEERKSDATRS